MEQEEKLRGLQEERSNLTMLVDTVGWQALMSTAKDQVELRMPGVLTKLDNILTLTDQEFEKGAISGIHLFMQLPEIRIAVLDDEIEKIEVELGYADGERTDSGDESGEPDRGDTFAGDAP